MQAHVSDSTVCHGGSPRKHRPPAGEGADATLISYNDVVSGGINGTAVITAASPLTWTHDINDSLDVTSDLIKTVTLSIVLLDPQRGNESIDLNLDSTGFFHLVTNVPNSGHAASYSYDLSSLQFSTLLQTDGLLSLSLRVVQQGSDGDPNVTFQSSTLSGVADTGAHRIAGPAPVTIAEPAPVAIAEPATLTLVGAGLVGAGAVRRRSS